MTSGRVSEPAAVLEVLQEVKPNLPTLQDGLIRGHLLRIKVMSRLWSLVTMYKLVNETEMQTSLTPKSTPLISPLAHKMEGNV